MTDGLNQILPMNGAMNQDSHPKYVRSSDGEIIERVNLRPNSINGNRFLNTKIKGNTLITDDEHSVNPFVLPNGNNKCIGWCRDYQNDAVIYFIYNEDITDPNNPVYRHCILRYYQKKKSIEKVWWEHPELGFEDSIIRAFVADKMLYWCNGDQPLKSFEIERAVNFTNGSHIGDDKTYTNFGALDLENILPMCKRPPQFAPEVEYWDVLNYEGVTIDFNNLREKMFQFKYKYTYIDNQESAYSPISKVPLPDSEVTMTGDFSTTITFNNAIKITYNTGSGYVKKITIAARECQDRSALGDFYIIEEIDKFDFEEVRIPGMTDNTELSTYFLNINKLQNINTDINNRYCDDTPLSASDMLLLDGKYCTIAMPVKNYDDLDVDYDIEIVETTVTTLPIPNGLLTFYDPINHNYTITILSYLAATIYSISFQDIEGGLHYYWVNSNDVSVHTPTGIADELAKKIDDDKEDIPKLNTCTNTGAVITIDFQSPAPVNFPTGNTDTLKAQSLGGIIGQGLNPLKTLKRGQYHYFVIIYNDGFGRYNIAYGDKELYSPHEYPGDFTPHVFSTIQCRMSINNKPPDWATTYRIGYLPNRSYTYFIQIPYVECISNGIYPNSTYEGLPSGYVFLRINQAIARMRLAFPNTYIPDYIFQKGDRVRAIHSLYIADSYEILQEYTATYTVNGGDETTEVGYLIKANAPDTLFYVMILEIYRPNTALNDTTTLSNIFYEIGEEYQILDAGTDDRRHDGDTAQTLDVNHNPLTPAILNLDFGDCYLRGRMGFDAYMYVYPQMVEDMHHTDFYTSSGIDIGRVTAKIDSEQKELNSIVRSEQFIEGSQINWLNVFLFDTIHFDASDIYGRITGIEEMGGTLKVIQEHKENSIMIGEVTAKQADLGDWIYIGDTVFGACRRYPEDRGSIYRKSIASNIRYLYYFDEATGEFIRSSPNGQIAISKDYNMQNWFEKKAKALRESDGYKDVIVAFDNDYEEVLVSFLLEDTIETLVFSEREDFKGWTFFCKYYNDDDIPEMFATYKDNLISFMNGQLYLHGQGTNNTFYGKLHECNITVPINQYASMIKRFSSIKISSDVNLWNCEFTIPQGENYPAQKSKLVPARMREKENVLYSDILRNMVNRAGVEDVNLINTGNRMAGEYLKVKLSDSTSDDILLGMVQVNFLIAK